MNIMAEFKKIFAGEQQISLIERETLLDAMVTMNDDKKAGIHTEIMALKIQGAIEFLAACGRISEEQEEQLWTMVNEIGTEGAEA